MSPKQIRERKFAIMKQRSHPNHQQRDAYQNAHLHNGERYHQAWCSHAAAMEYQATLQTNALKSIAESLKK